MKHFLLITFFLICQNHLHASDLNTLESRIKADLIAKTDISEASIFASSQLATGAWTNVDYGDRDRSRWLPIIHLRQLRAIAAAYRTTGHPLYNKQSTVTKIEIGLQYWYNRNSASNNWWHQEINAPQQLGAILLIMRGNISANLVDQGQDDLRAAKNSSSDTYWSAQNTIYTSFSRIYLAILEDDSVELVEQLNRVKAEAAIKTGLGRTTTNQSSKEGIRADYSFYQHGPALYNGFYGAHFVYDMGFWIAMTDGLSFQFNTTQKNTIIDYVLEGHGWMNRFGTFDPNVTNRKISHDNYDYVTLRYHDPVLDGLKYLRNLNFARSAEVEAFYQHMAFDGPSIAHGNRSFWKTDFMVQAGSGYQVSTKLWSYHNEGTEFINGDGIQGQFLSVGGTFLMLEGDEYKDIFPIWDWGRVPGTTTLHRDPANPPSGQLGTQKFAGGVSNQAEGAMAYSHNYDSVTGNKSWFYFDDCYVMLGSGISASTNELEVNTTVNQIFLSGPVRRKTANQETNLPMGETTNENTEWVFHDDVGYIFPQGGSVTTAAKTQSGSWFEINDSLPSTPRSADVFSLWFNHGTAPIDQSYACIVVPGKNQNEFVNFEAANPIQILENTEDRQAVHHTGRNLTQISFFSPGSISLPSGTSVSVSQSCLLMFDESTSPPQITVADPTQELAGVFVTIDEPTVDAVTVSYAFPSKDNAGRSTDTPSVIIDNGPILGGIVSDFSQQTSTGLASYIIDGSTTDDNTRWATNSGYPQYVEIDLGMNQLIRGFEVFTYANRAYQYKIETKQANGIYNLAIDRRDNFEDGPILDLLPINVTARFVKITITGASNYTGSWISLNELRIFEAEAQPDDYSEWLITVDWGATPSSLREPTADPDADGRNNKLEWALGSDPTNDTGQDGLHFETTLSSNDSVIYKVSYQKAVAGLIYTIVHSSDLENWSDQYVSAEGFDSSTGLHHRTWSHLQPKGFVRLKVE